MGRNGRSLEITDPSPSPGHSRGDGAEPQRLITKALATTLMQMRPPSAEWFSTGGGENGILAQRSSYAGQQGRL